MLKLNNYSNHILQDITLSIKDNFIILGENGSGKTTLAKALCNLLELKPSNPNHINYIPAKLEIFDEYLNVKEFLELSVLKKDISIKEVLEKLEISYLQNNFLKSLSSGEGQLVLLASALLQKSKYTIFDEPTANLDPIKTHKVFKILKSFKYLSKKIVITHDLNMAFHLGFDILYLENGKISFIGKNKKFFKQKNLDNIFNGYVLKKDNSIMIKL